MFLWELADVTDVTYEIDFQYIHFENKYEQINFPLAHHASHAPDTYTLPRSLELNSKRETICCFCHCHAIRCGMWLQTDPFVNLVGSLCKLVELIS